MKEKIYVEIAGIKLGIVSEDGREYVEQVAKTVNDEVNAVLKSSKGRTLVEAALFCAMTHVGQGGEDSLKVRNLETQIALYQANLNILKRENEELRAKLEGNNEEYYG